MIKYFMSKPLIITMYEESMIAMVVSEFDFDGKQKTLAHTRFTTRVIESHECPGLIYLTTLLPSIELPSTQIWSRCVRSNVFDWLN